MQVHNVLEVAFGACVCVLCREGHNAVFSHQGAHKQWFRSTQHLCTYCTDSIHYDMYLVLCVCIYVHVCTYVQ